MPQNSSLQAYFFLQALTAQLIKAANTAVGSVKIPYQKRLSAALILPFIAISHAYADDGIINPSSTLTSGPFSANTSVYAGVLNPALGTLMVPARESFCMAYAPSFATDIELGQVDNFASDLDDLIDIIDDPSSTTEPVQSVLDRFNSILVKMGAEGYLKNSINLHLPLLPLYWKIDQLPGTLMVDASINTQIKASVLDAPLSYDDQNNSFSTATSAYLKAAIEKSVAVGYSQPLLDKDLAQEYGGQLLAGAKFSIYNVELSKQTFLLQQLDGKDIDTIVSDEFDKNLQSTTGVGLDIGLVWLADRYRLGATLLNITQPTFDYGVIGENCQSRTEGSRERANCEAAADFAQIRGDIKTRESHKKTARLNLDGHYLILPNWSVGGALETIKYDDFVGTENQMLNISTQYAPKNQWVPDMRFGYQKNLAGSKLSSIAVGLSFWQTLTLDVKWGMESVTVDGSSGPRDFGFAIGVAEKF